MLGFTEDSDEFSIIHVSEESFPVRNHFLADDCRESMTWCLVWEPKDEEKVSDFFFAEKASLFKKVSSFFELDFNLLVRKPLGVRPEGH